MNTFLAAVYAKFVSGTDLYDALSGRLYYDRAPAGVSEPYGIYFLTTAVPADTFNATIDEVGIQFSFFTGTSLTNINNLVEYCRELYDNKKLSNDSVMQRVLTIPARRSTGDQDATWQADIEFIAHREV